MSDLSSKWTQATFADLLSATGSAELEAGPKPSASQTGRKICRSGPDRHPVSPSALPGSGSGAMTLDTSPPILSIWSGPAAPECCLASRSQARLCSERLQSRLDQTLAAHLSGLGSTIYAIAWKQHVTPLGRTISRQRASARRTSDNAPSSEPFPKSGWPTAQASDGSGGGQAKRAMNPERSNDLMDFAMLAGWPTPTARDHFPAHSEEYIAAKKAQGHGMANLNDLGQLAAWATPVSQQANGTPEAFLRRKRESMERGSQSMGVCLSDLNMQAQAWAADSPARFTASGQMLTGCSAGMPSGGQLSPAHSRWLMGYRRSWDRAGINAALGMKSKRKKAR